VCDPRANAGFFLLEWPKGPRLQIGFWPARLCRYGSRRAGRETTSAVGQCLAARDLAAAGQVADHRVAARLGLCRRPKLDGWLMRLGRFRLRGLIGSFAMRANVIARSRFPANSLSLRARTAQRSCGGPSGRRQAIAYGNFGFQSCSKSLDWIPKLRWGRRSDSELAPKPEFEAICDCPGGEGAFASPRSGSDH
jgi:hypothetical protein